MKCRIITSKCPVKAKSWTALSDCMTLTIDVKIFLHPLLHIGNISKTSNVVKDLSPGLVVKCTVRFLNLKRTF